MHIPCNRGCCCIGKAMSKLNLQELCVSFCYWWYMDSFTTGHLCFVRRVPRACNFSSLFIVVEIALHHFSIFFDNVSNFIYSFHNCWNIWSRFQQTGHFFPNTSVNRFTRNVLNLPWFVFALFHVPSYTCLVLEYSVAAGVPAAIPHRHCSRRGLLGTDDAVMEMKPKRRNIKAGTNHAPRPLLSGTAFQTCHRMTSTADSTAGYPC